MADLRIDEGLWASSMLPEGIVERWRFNDGASVAVGDALADVRIEDVLHEILAPTAGRLTILAATNAVVEPGGLLARVGD